MNNKYAGGSFKATIIALCSAVIITIVLLAVSSDSPIKSILFFFSGPLTNTYNLGNMLDKAGLLIIAGLGMSIAFRAGVFNLGGEGQVYAGAMAAVIVALNIDPSNRFAGIFTVVLAGVLSGAFLAGISGYLKSKFNTDELISSFLISGITIHLVDYLITNPFRDKNSFLSSTDKIPVNLFLKQISGNSHLNISFILALISTVIAFIFIFKTALGYEIRLSGLNRKFSEYGGIPVKKHYIVPMLISGAMYGAAGSFAALGNFHMGIKGFTNGLGWNGIAVALIAANNPAFIIPGALIFAYLDAGTQIAMIHSDLSFEFSNLIRAVIFFLITAKRFNCRKAGSLD